MMDVGSGKAVDRSGVLDGRHCLRRPDRRPGPDGAEEPADDTLAASEERRAVVCARCSAEITSIDSSKEVDGSHRHAFFNPAGLLFEIGCFRSASGCLELGVASTEFSWFPGYAWRFSVCRQCRTHLGWMFVSRDGADVFWGLILNRLAGEV